MNSTNKQMIANFIEEIWNQKQFEKIGNYISADFIDHSLPPNLSADVDGMKQWIIGIGKSFEHKTIIDEIVCEENKVMLKVRMQLKHIGYWRGIEPTLSEISTIGFRYYKFNAGKIAEHWALIDGNSIKNQLMEAKNGSIIQH